MHRARIAGFALLLMAAPVACDTNVSNPGPVQDEFLNDRNAAAAMVSGAGRALSQGMNFIGYTGAAVAR
jgi:starch-binding outer membrane protein, SusD/RagB family